MPSLIQLLLGICLIILSVEDVGKGIIKDRWLLLIAILALFHPGDTQWTSCFILGGVGVGLYFGSLFLFGKEGVGWGDVKMMAVSGLWVPSSEIHLFLLLTGGLGILIALITRLGYKKAEFPLGPALAVALWVCAFGNLGEAIGGKNDLFFFGGFVGPGVWGTA